MVDKKRFIILDANSLIHRAYHALPPLTAKTGQLANAVYGFSLILLKTIKDFKPDYIASAFDFPAPTFRHHAYKEYKATRVRAPDDFYAQIPIIKDILKACSIKIFEQKGFEADDIIGTITAAITRKREDLEFIILSGDLDFLQLVDSQTKVYALKKGVTDIVIYDKERVGEKYEGLSPAQLIDLKALKGDPSDNIPGLKGVGEKTALSLIKEFGSLEKLYNKLKTNQAEILALKKKLKETLVSQKDIAFLGRELVKIRRDVPLEFHIEECIFLRPDPQKLDAIFEGMGFKSLVGRLGGVNKPSLKKRPKPKKQTDEIRKELPLW